MSDTPHLPFSYIPEGTIRGEILFNEAVNVLDAVVYCYVKGIQAAPPTTPANGDRFIVASSSASGAWAGKENHIACWYDGWVFVPPQEGFFPRVLDSSLKGFFMYNGSAWVSAGTIADLSGGDSLATTIAKVNTLLAALRTIGILRV